MAKAKTVAKAKKTNKPARVSKSSAGKKVRAKSPVSRGDVRRDEIIRALHHCIMRQGFAKTTLADIADEAGMYSSHLLYYFNGKEDMFKHYFQKVAAMVVERLEGFRGKTGRQQIRLLAQFFFGADGIDKSELGFMFECFGIAVNDEVLRQEKAQMDKACKDYLRELFENSPKRLMKKPKDCAEAAYALLIGLRAAVLFDEELALKNAYGLFYDSMMHLAGEAPIRRG